MRKKFKIRIENLEENEVMFDDVTSTIIGAFMTENGVQCVSAHAGSIRTLLTTLSGVDDLENKIIDDLAENENITKILRELL